MALARMAARPADADDGPGAAGDDHVFVQELPAGLPTGLVLANAPAHRGRGVEVVRIDSGGSAEGSLLRCGDRIVAINDQDVRTLRAGPSLLRFSPFFLRCL